MPDTPVADRDGTPYDPAMEMRVSRLEEDMREVKATTTRLEATVIEIKAMLAATLPHLATKTEIAELKAKLGSDIAELKVGLAEKPSKTYMWGILAVLLTAYACGLAGLAILK